MSTVKKKKQKRLNLVLYTYCTLCSTTFAVPLFWTVTPHTHTHTNTTITTAMCTVNCKELKKRFRKHVTQTCLLGNVRALHSDSSVIFSYVIRNSNQVRVSLPENTLSYFMLLSCWLLVTDISL